MTCEHCGREFFNAKSESRFDAFGRRVCRKACSLWPLNVAVGTEQQLYRLRSVRAVR